MLMVISLISSVFILLFCIVCAIIQSKKEYKIGRILDPSKWLFIGVVLASIVMFVPIYLENFRSSDCGIFETALISIHNTIRLFVVDGEFDFITSNIPSGVPEWASNIYVALFAVLFVAAPILTFGFVLSFFKNVSAFRKCFLHRSSDVYVFSELNSKSIALAESLHGKKGENRFMVFTDVFENDNEKDYELIERTKKIGAACFKKDITTVDFTRHGKKGKVVFLVIGEDQSENIVQVLKLYEKYKNKKKAEILFFSTQKESELYLTNTYDDSDDRAEDGIKIRRINDVQSLIYHNLYESGYGNIFCSALPDENSGLKQINAVVVGMGLHGTEMTKALTWLCQMDGYRVRIDSLDKDEKAEEKFTSQCPELMSFSDNNIPGESKYSLHIHSKMDVETVSFDRFVSGLTKTTYVFVALGNDEKNLEISVKLRSLFERMKINPIIQTVIYNPDMKNLLTGIKNFKKQEYDIDFIGDVESSYSEDVILNSSVEKEALNRHLEWGKEKDFWRYDYNYRSSVASAIHRKMKILCKVPGIEKDKKNRTPEELRNLRILEHIRWNAYMRSEGYIYGGTIEKTGRNDLAKTHNCLVPFDELPLNEQEKDDD